MVASLVPPTLYVEVMKTIVWTSDLSFSVATVSVGESVIHAE